MTTAIHCLMNENVPYVADSYDPIDSYKVVGDTLKIVVSCGYEYEVNLKDVAFWEFVEGNDVTTADYFSDWLAKAHHKVAIMRKEMRDA